MSESEEWRNLRLDIPPIKRTMETDPTYCGCAMGQGMFGSHGWHWKRADQALLYDRAKRLFAAERVGWSPAVLRDEWRSYLDKEQAHGRFNPTTGMHEAWKPYIGTPFAIERCPPYMAAYSKSLEAKKKKEASGRNRKVLGDE